MILTEIKKLLAVIEGMLETMEVMNRVNRSIINRITKLEERVYGKYNSNDHNHNASTN